MQYAANTSQIKYSLYNLHNWTGKAHIISRSKDFVDMTIKPQFDIFPLQADTESLWKKMDKLVNKSPETIKPLLWPNKYTVTRNPVTVTLSKEQAKANPDLERLLSRENTGLANRFVTDAIEDTNISSNRGIMLLIKQMHDKHVTDNKYTVNVSDLAIFAKLLKVNMIIVFDMVIMIPAYPIFYRLNHVLLFFGYPVSTGQDSHRPRFH